MPRQMGKIPAFFPTNLMFFRVVNFMRVGSIVHQKVSIYDFLEIEFFSKMQKIAKKIDNHNGIRLNAGNIESFAPISSVSGDGYYYYGFEVANQILEGKDWTRDGRFARVTLCDFKIRAVG